MPYITNQNKWENYLQYNVVYSSDEWKKIAYHRDLEYFPPVLKTEVETWLEENIGFTSDSPWHKDQYHPAKPKWHFTATVEQSRYNDTFYCIVKFYTEEDALAFKLAWS